MTLGNAIKVVRTASGMKQRTLAKKVGVTANYLSLVEGDKREPSISFLNRLAQTLTIPVGVFFLWQEVDTKRGGAEQLDKIRELLTRLEGMYLAERNPRVRRSRRAA